MNDKKKCCPRCGFSGVTAADLKFGMTIYFKDDGTPRLVVRQGVAPNSTVLLIDVEDASVGNAFSSLDSLAEHLNRGGLYSLERP